MITKKIFVECDDWLRHLCSELVHGGHDAKVRSRMEDTLESDTANLTTWLTLLSAAVLPGKRAGTRRAANCCLTKHKGRRNCGPRAAEVTNHG